MQNVSTDTNKVLKEKLALSRELSILKPELEHLRMQTSSHQELLAEKLSLQRQLSTIQVELENEKRSAQRTLEKGRKSNARDIIQESHLEDLRQELSKERQDREKAEKSLQEAQREVESEKRKAQLVQAKDTKASKKSEQQASKVEELQDQLKEEKREREKAAKETQKAQTEWESQKAVLEDKLSQFRTKLRSTKDKLKDTEVELTKAQEVAATAATKAVRNPRKRNAVSEDPDAVIGTPGDGVPAKRIKRGGSIMGDKSTFSITPFLNRTASLAPEDSPEEQAAAKPLPDHGSDDEAGEKTPSAAPKAINKKPADTKPKPLAPAPSKANPKVGPKPPPRKRTTGPSLEAVTEEGPEDNGGAAEKDQPSKPIEKVKANAKAGLVAKPAPAARKSLASFATFNAEPAPEKKKKRRLLGSSGLGTTLFDVEEDEGAPKASVGRGLFFGGQRALGAIAAKKAAAKGSGLITTEEGFQFSPLKKDRKAALVK